MKKKNVKEKYEKPKLNSIKLHADEVLTAGCKNLSQSGALSGVGCGLPTTPCSAAGS